MFIDGEWRDARSGATFDVTNPATGEVIAAAAPFGGVKDSGLGREGGAAGVDEYLDVTLGGFAI